MNKRIIIFGDLPIATKAAEEIFKISGVKLVGVVIRKCHQKHNNPWSKASYLYEYATNNIPIFTLNGLEQDNDL